MIPNKAFQALACGTPLVTADTPAARELLRDGESALLVPAGDAAALAAALRRLAADAELAAADRRGRPRGLPASTRARRCSASAGAACSSGCSTQSTAPSSWRIAGCWAARSAAFAGRASRALARVLRHLAFDTGRFDLGNMVQAVWATAHGDVLSGHRPAR